MKKPILYLLVIGVALSLILPRSVSAATVNFTESPGVSWMKLNSAGSNNNYLIHNSGDGNNLEFAANNNGVMNWQILNINRNGNVGIGTGNPQSKLHVAGDMRIERNGGSALIVQTPQSDVRLYGLGGKPFLIPEGNVCIGCYSPTHKLSVNGTIKAREVIVSSLNWADYVFEDEYKLLSLDEVEQFINTYKHLPNIPSAKEVEKNGISVGEMQRLQMEKIEELTLYSIQLSKDNQSLKKENEDLKTRLEKIESILNIK